MTEEKKKSVMAVVIYGAVLFVVAALLITMSIIINVRNTKRLENQVDVTQQGAERAQTTLVNIQEENEALRKLINEANARVDEIKAQNEELSSQAEADAAHIASLDALAAAGMHIINGKFSLAREQLDLVNVELLTEDELAAYERMYSRVH
jgi:regulator of replication initiation timing